jgi:hypothetical protein
LRLSAIFSVKEQILPFTRQLAPYLGTVRWEILAASDMHIMTSSKADRSNALTSPEQEKTQGK